MVGVLQSKLMPPSLSPYIIARPRIVKILSSASIKLITLKAPAGYGKSIIMCQLAEAFDKPLVWYQLDAYDNDGVLFLQTLITGINRYFPEFGREVLQTIEQSDLRSRLRLIITAFTNELAARCEKGMIIVFDDFHRITEPFIHIFIKELIDYLPSGLKIMIASRTELPFSVSRSKLSGYVSGIGREELAFTSAEIKAFMELGQKNVSKEIIEVLSRNTGGWPAALRLLGEENWRVEKISDANKNKEIFTYILSEVFSELSADIREFLMATAVLDSVVPDFCNLFLDRNDSFKILKYLEKQGLFLIPLSGQKKVYRYHQLFREFLLEQLGERKKTLLKRAGELAFSLGDLEVAVGYLSVEGLEVDLIPVLIKAGQQALFCGRWQTVAYWLQNLSQDRISKEPWLCMFQATVGVNRGKLYEAEFWVSKAEIGFSECGDQLGLGESQILRSRIMRYHGQYQRCLQLLQTAEINLGVEVIADRLGLILEKAYCLVVTGDSEKALRFLEKALKSARTIKNGFFQASLLEMLGNIFYAQGKYAKALQAYHRSSEVTSDGILPNYYMQDLIPFIYKDWGQLDLALEYAERNLAIRESLGLFESLPSVYHSLSYIHLELGNFQLVEEYSKKAIQMISDYGGDNAYLMLNKMALAWALFLQNQWTEAKNQAEETLVLIDQNQNEMIQSSCQVCIAGIYALMGDCSRAKQLLFAGISVLEHIHHQSRLCDGYRTLAFVHFCMGETKPAQEYSRKYLSTAAAMNYVQGFITTSYEMYQPILHYALEQGIEIVFVQRVLIRLGGHALPILQLLANHQDPEIRARTILPLAEIGDAQASLTLEKMICDPNPQVRRLASLITCRFSPGSIGGLSNKREEPVVPLTIQVMGRSKIYLHKKEVTNWRTIKTRELLLYLAHQDGPVSKETLIEELWNDFEPDRATGLLRTTLYYLRKILSENNCSDLLQTKNKYYYLQAGDYELDRHRFEELISRSLVKGTDPGLAADLLENAVKLYQGEYLRDIHTTWVILFQVHINQLHSQARLRLAYYYTEKENYIRALNHLNVLERIDPLNEEVYGLLMTVYAKMGQRKEVKTKYQTLKANLAKEVGIKPSDKVSELYRGLIG